MKLRITRYLPPCFSQQAQFRIKSRGIFEAELRTGGATHRVCPGLDPLANNISMDRFFSEHGVKIAVQANFGLPKPNL